MEIRKKYPLEYEAERLLRELSKLVKKVGRFFFVIPKKKMDKYIYVMETLAWLSLTIALVLRIWR